MVLQDPQHLADRLAMTLPAQPGSRFQCGKATRFYASDASCDIQCETNPCTTVCTPTLMTAFNIEADGCDKGNTVDVFADTGWSVSVPQVPNGPWGDFWLAEFVSGLDSFITPTGTVELSWLLTGTATMVDDNGDENEIPVTNLILTYKQSPTAPGTPLVLVLANDKRGIDQVLYFAFENDSDFFLKQRGYIYPGHL